MTSTWQVHSYYIGVGVVGDSATHLLINKPASGGAASVEYALLVDGGESGGKVRLASTIKHIEQSTSLYNLSPLSSDADRKLKFSAVVITHWDTDHWQGVLFAMRDDINKQVSKGAGPVTNMETSFFQYDN
ncbi:endoribonuclease LACTB2 [Microdochium nivale]|nr:endoribonuclease LACTB2 [Microdochium nivale]